MKVIIIDDEEKGREHLRKLIEKYSKKTEVVAVASGIEEAYQLILTHKPDAIFLDVEMPDGDGFSLLDKFASRDFKVIVTTAFDEYAIRAVRKQVFDYLMKPIDIDELLLSIERADKHIRERSSGKEPEVVPSQQPSRLALNARLAIPVKDGVFFLTVSDITRIDSDGGYCTFYVSDGKKYVVAKNLKDYEDILPEKEFFRIHRSHLINIKKARKYIRTDGNFLEMEDGAIVEISRRKKDEFLQIMNAL